jgi:hypothetical protein
MSAVDGDWGRALRLGDRVFRLFQMSLGQARESLA